MPRFTTIKQLRTSPARSAVANDNSANSIYAYSSEIEDLLRRLQKSGNPGQNSQTALRRRLHQVAMAGLTLALVCGVPACAAALLLLKPESEHAHPAAKQQFTAQKADQLALPASSVAYPSLVADADLSADPRADADPIDTMRGSIADAARVTDRSAPPAPHKRSHKRHADRALLPTRPENAVPPAPSSLFEPLFSLRTLFGQTSPQT
jgi:hypothetical protein